MVDLPSSITVAVWPEVRTDDRSSAVPFEVRNAEGRAAVADGLAVLAETG